MSRIHNSRALPYTLEERFDLDYHADLWVVPWRKLGFDYCGIYIIAPEGKWPIKIGISEDAAKRLNTLQTAHWHQMGIISYWLCSDKATARKLETKCHFELQGRRLMGEWFDIKADKAVDMVEFCATLANVELAKKIPETARFQSVKDYIEGFYEARGRHLDKTISCVLPKYLR